MVDTNSIPHFRNRVKSRTRPARVRDSVRLAAVHIHERRLHQYVHRTRWMQPVDHGVLAWLKSRILSVLGRSTLN